MKHTVAIIIITAMLMALLTGCVQAATTANTNVEVLTESEATSVFELSTVPTVTPVITYVPEEIAELKAEVMLMTAAIGSLPEQTAEPAEGASPAPEETKAPEVTEKPEATATPGATEKPEYTVSDVEDQDGYVYAKSVNLRSGPGTSYDVIKEYEQYRQLTVTGKSGDWYQVKIGSRTGFMLKKYVKLGEVPEATPTPTLKPTATPEPTATPGPTAMPEVTPEPTAAPTAPPSSDMPSSGSYTSDELYLLAQLVYKEGDGPSYTAVATVILNRINSSKFPNTVSGVVYQKNQFSTSNLKTPSSAAKEAVTSVFVNGNTVLPSDVYYFRTASSWSGHELYGKIGENYFYY